MFKFIKNSVLEEGVVIIGSKIEREIKNEVRRESYLFVCFFLFFVFD